jgi:3-dehydroquinate dehydratase II
MSVAVSEKAPRLACPRLFVLNGPNLDLLGTREPEIYGRDTLADIERACRAEAGAAGLDLVFRQSNAEHRIIEWIHEARSDAAGIILNPAAFSHSSFAIHDALKACTCPILEVHISNIHGRAEPWRAHSIVSAAATGVIAGLGTNGYRLAVRHLACLITEAPSHPTGITEETGE